MRRVSEDDGRRDDISSELDVTANDAMSSNGQVLTKPLNGIGGFFAMALDTFAMMSKRPFVWQYVIQPWFVARVSVPPALELCAVSWEDEPPGADSLRRAHRLVGRRRQHETQFSTKTRAE